MARTVSTAELVELVGQDLPVSDWLEITQDRVNQFAGDDRRGSQPVHRRLESWRFLRDESIDEVAYSDDTRLKAGGTSAHNFIS